MFRRAKNIDTAFKNVRSFSIITIVFMAVLSGFIVFKCFAWVKDTQSKIYILANSKAYEAFAADRKQNIPVEARDHVKSFHEYFFTLDPDEKVILSNMVKAMNLADGSAKREYDNLKERGYYANIISGNISQTIQVDSIQISIEVYPYVFRCYATQNIIRATSVVSRLLITEGQLRNVARSDNNPHGFLIERWETIQNSDIKMEKR